MKRAIGIILSSVIASNLLIAADGLHLTTVVIDAGHGGKDPGAVSPDKKTYEKTIVLDIAQRLADKIKSEFPEVSVIMTRDKDEFIPLNVRADIANKADANLFISIHVNASSNHDASGFSMHVMGQSRDKGTDLYELNMGSVMRENSVIQLEDDYSVSYEGFNPSDPESYIFLQLMQNAYLEQSLSFAQIVKTKLKGWASVKDKGIWQNPFLVLWKTAMPAILIEAGFISNASDLSKLKVAANRDDFAERLLCAFREYKYYYDRSMMSTSSASSAGSSGIVRYGVQIFAGKPSSYVDSKAFLGYDHEIFDIGGTRKYVIAISDSPSVPEAELGKIRKKYPDAFIVRIESGTPVIYKK